MFPIKFGIIIARVFFVILFEIFASSICRVLILISTNIGFKLKNKIDEIAVPKFRHGTIISSFELKFRSFKHKIIAEDPEFTITPYL